MDGVQPGLPPEPPADLAVPDRLRRDSRLVTLPPSRKRSVSHRAIARRAVLIVWAKRLLPALALALLTCIVMWPEFNRLTEAGKTAVNRMTAASPQGGELIDARYRGVDARGRPYNITASAGRQLTAQQVALTNPRADTVLQNGSWAMLTADAGLYVQHASLLDLSGHVVLYRDDGTFLRSQTVTMDLSTGFATGNHPVSVEGPFGTLDATGFAVADKGAMIQFAGPARLILNAKSR